MSSHCDGTACHGRARYRFLKTCSSSVCRKTKNNRRHNFTVETVSCLGACGLALVITVNDKVYAAMTPEKAVELINNLKEEIDRA